MDIYKVSFALIALIILSSGVSANSQDSPDSTHIATLDGLVSVDTGNSSSRKGMGLVISPDGHILTSSAVIDTARNVRVGSATGQDMKTANVVSINHDLGLALLQIEALVGEGQAAISLSSAATGDRVASITGADADRITGEVITTLRYQQSRFFKHNAIVEEKIYGTPLVNDCNEVLAINIVDPAVGRRQARKLPSQTPTAYAIGRDSVVDFLTENQVQYQIAAEPCLTLEARAEIEAERAEQEAERADGAESDARAKQEAIDQAEAEIARKQEQVAAAEERARVAQEDADRRAEELEKVNRDRRANAAQKKEAEEAAAEARRVAESAAEDAAGLSEEIESLNAEAEALAEKLRLETRRQYIIIGGAGALILFIGLLFSVLLSKRGKKLKSAEAGLSVAHAKLSETFSDIEFRGQDEAGAPFAFIVTGASLLKTPQGVVVGRQPQSATIVLNHAEVSRAHARITLRSGVARLEDLGSTNGTTHNGVDLQSGQDMALNSGDVVEFGKVRLNVRFIDA